MSGMRKIRGYQKGNIFKAVKLNGKLLNKKGNWRVLLSIIFFMVKGFVLWQQYPGWVRPAHVTTPS